MSERYSASVDSYAEAPARDVAERAGLSIADFQEAIASAGAALDRLAARAQERAEQLHVASQPGDGEEAHNLSPSGDVVLAQALNSALKDPKLDFLSASARAEVGTEVMDAIDDRLANLHQRWGKKEGDQESFQRRAEEFRRTLEGAVERGVARLARAEAETLVQHAAETLVEMGYSVDEPRRSRSGTLFLRGTDQIEDTAVYIAADEETGRLEFDFSGFRGTSCVEARRRLVRGLSRRGVQLREQNRAFHGRSEGGRLVHAAAPMFAQEDREIDEEQRRQIAFRVQRRSEVGR